MKLSTKLFLKLFLLSSLTLLSLSSFALDEYACYPLSSDHEKKELGRMFILEGNLSTPTVNSAKINKKEVSVVYDGENYTIGNMVLEFFEVPDNIDLKQVNIYLDSAEYYNSLIDPDPINSVEMATYICRTVKVKFLSDYK